MRACSSTSELPVVASSAHKLGRQLYYTVMWKQTWPNFNAQHFTTCGSSEIDCLNSPDVANSTSTFSKQRQNYFLYALEHSRYIWIGARSIILTSFYLHRYNAKLITVHTLPLWAFQVHFVEVAVPGPWKIPLAQVMEPCLQPSRTITGYRASQRCYRV